MKSEKSCKLLKADPYQGFQIHNSQNGRDVDVIKTQKEENIFCLLSFLQFLCL